MQDIQFGKEENFIEQIDLEDEPYLVTSKLEKRQLDFTPNRNCKEEYFPTQGSPEKSCQRIEEYEHTEIHKISNKGSEYFTLTSIPMNKSQGADC